jgi:hypothetical protein
VFDNNRLFPIRASDYTADKLLRDSVYLGESSLRRPSGSVAVPDFAYLCLSKFSGGIRDAFISNGLAHGSASFIRHIFHIIKLSALKQMRRINTSSIVTFMTDLKSSNRFSRIMNFIRMPMSALPFSVYADKPVAVFVQFPCPIPALGNRVYINSTKKSVRQIVYSHAHILPQTMEACQ